MRYERLTVQQQNIWNLQKFYENTSIVNLCGSVIFEEPKDVELLKQSINLIIDKQTGLRLRFEESNHVRQYIADYEHEDIPYMSFSSKEKLDSFAEEFAKKTINLVNEKQYRFVVFDVDGRQGVLVSLSHMISDAWSFSLLIRQVDSAYCYLAGEVKEEPKEHDYFDYVKTHNDYLQSDRFLADEEYWEAKYKERPETAPIKLNIARNNVSASRIVRQLPVEIENSIKQYCDNQAVTPAVLFEMALMIYLYRVNRDITNVTVGVPVLNRGSRNEKETIGMFISTMPLTVCIEDSMSAITLARNIATEHMGLFRHQKYPYSNILKKLREKQSIEGNLYQAMISYQNAAADGGVKTQWFSNGYSEVPLTIHIDNRDKIESHTLTVDYQTVLMKDEREVDLFLLRYWSVLQQICKDSNITVGEIEILPDAEKRTLLEDFNCSFVDYQKDRCVHELFVEQAHKSPDDVAVVFEDKRLTYKELDEMSNSLAHFLSASGIEHNDVVPIIMMRSWHILVAMLGILKAGGAYMPVSPDYPSERIKYMFDIADVKYALTYGYDSAGLKDALESTVNLISLEDFSFEDNYDSVKNINKPDDLCYIIFTSGSTGKPKGVSITHRNVVNYSDANQFNVCHNIIAHHEKRIVSVTNLVFDIFVTESILPLLNGFTVFFANEDEVMAQKSLAKLIDKYDIEVMQTTPTKMKSYLLDRNNLGYLKTLKKIILGGEALPEELYLDLAKHTDATIFNIYGPAETTVWSTSKLVASSDITIGKPIANTQVYIVDKRGKLLPIGAAGELCIAGDGVGKGYINRPDLTNERFVPNPFANEENGHGKILYHTGDLAQYRINGEIEYLGRIDTQVKIRGLRIELGEIESVMSSFEGIQLAAVTDKKDENGHQYLVGYYTANETVEIDEKELRGQMSTQLPKYMVPNYFMRLDKMPMTASGKTDRKALPVPVWGGTEEEYVAASTDLEKALCALLSKLFNVDQVSVETDFFNDLGGDSLRAIEFVSYANSEGIDLSLQNVFDFPTVKKMCHLLNHREMAKVVYDSEEFEKYKGLLNKNVKNDNFIPKTKELGNVFLTGATGYLGAHILDCLMQEETGRIYCLVRNKEKLTHVLQYYFGNKYLGNDRIIPICGDITETFLSDNIIEEQIHTVIHTAASVKHYGSYEYFTNVNVNGTRNVVEFAKRVGAEIIHISTLSVSGDTLFDQYGFEPNSSEQSTFDEKDFFINQNLSNVYVRSKFEAERIVLDAILDGVSAKIVRVGNLTNRYSDGQFQINPESNATLTRIRAFFKLRVFPENVRDMLCDFTPIDNCASSIVAIAKTACDFNVFHVERKYGLEYILELLEKCGYHFEFVSDDEFTDIIKGFVQNNPELLQFANDLDDNNHLKYDVNVATQNDFTVWFFSKIGFEWRDIDTGYFDRYAEYLKKNEYIV